ncbi:hsp90 co-chaperone Cdc37 [Dimargaris verticillata]|uniref:Hsp90 chaperone protein kinase-targeting subunit n=1 Tax=Dimargaris verticillata TaxID=2761393 RepID=A0A9W8EAJ7_9FUNG|nr:hsp90 co-chaperone Cdc37 [Dimargaris verticillata]
MAPLNYSKWDNIELSDDEDVEVHPNVDKKSFIRWRQQAIHRERLEREAKIEAMSKHVASQTECVAELDRVLSVLKEGNKVQFQSWLQTMQEHAQQRQADPKAQAVASPTMPSARDMLSSMAASILTEIGAKDASLEQVMTQFTSGLDSHRKKLTVDIDMDTKKLDELEREKRHKVSVDELCRPGFDKTNVNKVAKAPAIVRQDDLSAESSSTAKPTTTKTVQSIEVLNADTLEANETEAKAVVKRPEPPEPVLTVEQIVDEFSDAKDMDATLKYISKYPNIVDESISDEILVKAFELGMINESAAAYKCVHQALILQYCARLGNNGVSIFVMRYKSDPRAKAMFEAEVKAMHQRIMERSKVLREERKANPKAEDIECIQLQTDDPEAPIEINVPSDELLNSDQLSEADVKVKELYLSLPEYFRKALQVGTLDKVNEAFAQMPGAEAEKVLNTCTEGGFIAIAGEMVVDPDDVPPVSTPKS